MIDTSLVDPKCPIKDARQLAALLQRSDLAPKERKRLETFAIAVINEFARTPVKNQEVMREAVALAPVHYNEIFRELLMKSIDAIRNSTLEELHVLNGLAEVIRNADRPILNKDDCVQILDVLHTRLRKTHEQSENLYKIIQVIARLLDALVDVNIAGVRRKVLHNPLSQILTDLTRNEDPQVSYQARYAHQALQHIRAHGTNLCVALPISCSGEQILSVQLKTSILLSCQRS
jgi:hypothetical protein